VDGLLRHLPFAALHDGRQWLGERVALVQRLPAGQHTARPTGRHTGHPTGVRHLDALGASQGDAELPPLPGVEAELCGLVDGPLHGLQGSHDPRGLPAPQPCTTATIRRLPGQAWLNQRFDTTRLQTTLATPSTAASALHIATHFRLRPGALGRSWLLTGQGQRVTLEQLSQWPMQARPLVSLSACDTAMGADELLPGEGRERDGLPGLFLRGGAQQVLAALWPVEDRSTAALMQQVYAGLRGQARVDQALRQAQQRLRRSAQHQHPAYWAGFVAFEAAPSAAGAATPR
jgi:CHAT domain-containing protein